MPNFWPTPQDYNESIQSPELCFRDLDLCNARVHLDSNGLPRAISGAFACVYRLEGDEHDYAVRCFLHPLLDQFERYKLLAEAFKVIPASFMVPFEYEPEGILVNGSWFPILKMEWVYGQTLERYVQMYLFDRVRMQMLLKQFDELCEELCRNGMAHGDLQPCNLMVTTEGTLKLVDYDGFFVPSMQGFRSNELGHPDFQHPLRVQDNFGPHLDNFSIWVMRTTLIALLHRPQLYQKFGEGTESFLFRRRDFIAPLHSAIFLKLLNEEIVEISESAKILLSLALSGPERHILLYLDGGDYSADSAVPFIERTCALLTEQRINRHWQQLIDKLPKEKVEPELVVTRRKAVLSSEQMKSRLCLGFSLLICWWFGLLFLLIRMIIGSQYSGCIGELAPVNLQLSMICWAVVCILFFCVRCIKQELPFARSKWLVANGVAVPAIIIEKEPNAISYLFEISRSDSRYEMMYGRLRANSCSDFSLAEPGDITTVLYDPRKPEINVLYCLQPYRALSIFRRWSV